MADIQIKAEVRTQKSTKKFLGELRDSKKIPGVVYGGKGGNIKIVVAERDLMSAIKTGGANAIIKLTHGKGEDTVIVKDLQRHVVNNSPLHVDFQRISLSEKIDVKVPIHVVGEAPGVKFDGGVLEHILREIEVQCLPNEIPEKIEIDVGQLKVGQAIHVNEISVPAGVQILADAEQIVVNIVHATIEEEVAPAEEGVEGAEPEVIAKGKKDEEGEEGAEADAKGAVDAKGDAKAGAKGDEKAAAKPGAEKEAKKEGDKKGGKK